MSQLGKTNRGAALVDRAELIKWYDALDELAVDRVPREVVQGLQKARECQHRDAVCGCPHTFHLCECS
jgi:hypothetical protein